MKIVKKLLSVLAVAALLAAPGTGPTSAFAQQGLGRALPTRSTGANGVGMPGSAANRGSSMQRNSNSRAVNLRGTTPTSQAPRPVVNNGSARVMPTPSGRDVTSVGLGDARVMQEMGSESVIRTVEGFALPNNSSVEGASSVNETVKAAEGRKTVETGAYEGQVKFDRARADLKTDAVVGKMGEFRGNALSMPNPNDADQVSDVPAPMPKMPVSPEVKAKRISTAIDFTVVSAVFATQGFKAGLAALVLYSGFRYSNDLAKILTEEKYGKYGGFVRYMNFAGTLLIMSPVALAVDGYQYLAKPALIWAKDLVVNALRAIKDAAVWVYNNVIVPVARFVRDLAKAGWEMVKDFANAVWEGLKAFGRMVRDLVIDIATFVRDFAKAAWTAIKDFARAAWELAKDAVQFLQELLTDVLGKIADAMIWVYDNVLTPLGHAIRGVSAGVIAGLVSAFVVIPAFLGAMGLNFVVQPLHNLFTSIAKWPLGFKIAASVVVPTGLVIAAMAAPILQGLGAVVGLTVAGSGLIGLIGGFATATAEGYRNGFANGIAKGVGDALKTASERFNSAKAKYNTWKIKK
jgi:hypothetical protein